MKILLRKHNGIPYVWTTAKYHGNNFYVDGEVMMETNIVSIINDNRKNYVRCSSCGKIFPRNGKKFRKHQELASTTHPGMSCRKRRANEIGEIGTKYIPNGDGTFRERYERNVTLYCRWSSFSSYDLDSSTILDMCEKRRCGYAKPIEIVDTFTQYPGLFDDIITVDSLLDHGIDDMIHHDIFETIYQIKGDITIFVYVNRLGIVDRFVVDGYGGYYTLWYSSKYGKLFTEFGDDQYEEWKYSDYHDNDVQFITDSIKALYE